ncbi:MAG: FecR domain-containing protein [Polyangiaceae bacterium]|jgi:TolA-binding protein
MSLDRAGANQILSEAFFQRIRQARGQMTMRARLVAGDTLVTRWMQKRPAARRRLRDVGLIGLAFGVLACAAVALVGERSRNAALSYAVEDGRVNRAGFISADPSSHPTVRFSDGSEVRLGAGAKMAIQSVDAHGARVSLAEGKADIEVMHKPGARWFVDAGPFLISVTGTAFDVAWQPDEERLDVRMQRGSVEVGGPLSDAAILLRSGQHLTVRVRQRETLIRDLEDETASTPPEADRSAADGLPHVAVPTKQSSATPAEASPAKSSGAGLRAGWAELLGKGEFATIVAEADRAGLDACLAEATSGQLAALADAARYLRRTDMARRALLALRKRFPQSAASHDAAYLLAWLDESDQDGARAIEAYGRYLGESPGGPYASEALGRKMELVRRLYGDERARPIADEYLGRFPDGLYAGRAKALRHLP